MSEATEETWGGGKVGRSGFTVPVLRRNRATAFSYLRTSVPQGVNGLAAKDWRNGEATGGESTSTASDRSMEYTYVNEVPSECYCGLCGEVRLDMHDWSAGSLHNLPNTELRGAWQ